MNSKLWATGAALACIAIATSGCSSATPAESETTIKAHGTITSSVPASLGYKVGGKCQGMGNDSMQKGKEFKIVADGKTQAIGKLEDGVLSSSGKCEFKFSAEVPAGLKFYTLDMGEFQGHKEFSEDEMAAGVTIDRIDLDDRQ